MCLDTLLMKWCIFSSSIPCVKGGLCMEYSCFISSLYPPPFSMPPNLHCHRKKLIQTSLSCRTAFKVNRKWFWLSLITPPEALSHGRKIGGSSLKKRHVSTSAMTVPCGSACPLGKQRAGQGRGLSVKQQPSSQPRPHAASLRQMWSPPHVSPTLPLPKSGKERGIRA